MPAPPWFRDSFVGQIVYLASGRRLLRYPEELPEFVLPERYAAEAADTVNCKASTCTRDDGKASEKGHDDGASSAPRGLRSETATLVERKSRALDAPHALAVAEGHFQSQEGPVGREVLHPTSPQDEEKGKTALTEKQLSRVETSRGSFKFTLVDWYGPDDPENAANWSFAKKCFVTFDISFITFAIYIGSAIYAPGVLLIADDFNVSPVVSTLGLTLFVAGYGIGPMFLSPLSEIPQLGRTWVYIPALFFFVILQIPTALCRNLAGLLVLRFLAGVVGSPPLATGGATLADMWAPETLSVVMGLWGVAACCGPVLGPTIGGFAAQAKGWQWTIWPLLMVSGAALVFLSVFLPETSSVAILYRRAVRLRKLTGNKSLRSQGELDADGLEFSEAAQAALVRPITLGFTEPIVICWNMYIALVYGILYIFIESFQVVFVDMHGFNLGENGLAFMVSLGLFFGVVISYAIFAPWVIHSLQPKFKNGTFVPEDRLPAAMVGAILIPISIFWFGWTSSPSIHWIVPIIGSAFLCSGVYLLFQSGIVYLADGYPRHVASVLAGNDLFRSVIASSFPLFSSQFFRNVGVGPACSILGGITILMIPIPFVLYRYGARIRAMSKHAD